MSLAMLNNNIYSVYTCHQSTRGKKTINSIAAITILLAISMTTRTLILLLHITFVTSMSKMKSSISSNISNFISSFDHIGGAISSKVSQGNNHQPVRFYSTTTSL